MDWDLVTNIILASSLATLAVFVFLGLYQWVTRRSIHKVDREIIWMLLPLALVLITYVIFDYFIVLNTRPNGSGEPSFPSTHTMIVATIFFSVMFILPRYIKSKACCVIIEILMVILIFLTCIGRVLANMHWPSDVIASVIFSLIFSGIYNAAIKKSKKKGTKNAQHLHSNHQQ